MSFYQRIIELGLEQNAPVRYERVAADSLRMANHPVPWSITETEFNYLYNYCRTYRVKQAYEIATAFGISSLAIGLALKEVSGRLVTMDAYLEETFNDARSYASSRQLGTEAADGYRSATFLYRQLELDKTIFPMIGYSPDDAPRMIRQHLIASDGIDLAFIDGLHRPENIILDTQSILPFLSKEFTIFYHDTQDFSQLVWEFLHKTFPSAHFVVPLACRFPAGFNLAYITNRL